MSVPVGTPATVRLDAIRAALDLLDEDTGMDGEPTPAAALDELVAAENALTAAVAFFTVDHNEWCDGNCDYFSEARAALAAVRSLTKGDTT